MKYILIAMTLSILFACSHQPQHPQAVNPSALYLQNHVRPSPVPAGSPTPAIKEKNGRGFRLQRG